MNGKKLTKAQLKKVDKIDLLFSELKKQGVDAMILDGGGNPSLTFWRNADLSIDVLYKNFPSKNVYHSAKTKIDSFVP